MRLSRGLLGMGIIFATSCLFLVTDTASPVRWTVAMISEARSFSSLIPTDFLLWLLIAILYSYYSYIAKKRCLRLRKLNIVSVDEKVTSC